MTLQITTEPKVRTLTLWKVTPVVYFSLQSAYQMHSKLPPEQAQNDPCDLKKL